MASQELSSLVITVMKNKRNTLRSPFHEYSVSRGEHFISTENEYTGGDHNSFFLLLRPEFSVNRKKCSDKNFIFLKCSEQSAQIFPTFVKVLSSKCSVLA